MSQWQESVDSQLAEIRTDVKKLLGRLTRVELKSGFWGTMGGLLAVILWKSLAL
jgi:hypothetical protein